MRRHYTAVQGHGGEVVGVSFEPRPKLFQLSRQMGLPFLLLSDPERDVYRAYGLRRGGLAALLGLGTLWTYLTLVLRGRRLRRPQSDVRQLGGDFVVDASGIVRYEHRGRSPHDRPPAGELLAVLERI